MMDPLRDPRKNERSFERGSSSELECQWLVGHPKIVRTPSALLRAEGERGSIPVAMPGSMPGEPVSVETLVDRRKENWALDAAFQRL